MCVYSFNNERIIGYQKAIKGKDKGKFPTVLQKVQWIEQNQDKTN